MGVDRTDYLMWGVMVDPDQAAHDDLEAERYQEDGARFDLIYDGMSGKYAVAGKIVAKSDPHEGIDFVDIGPRVGLIDKAAVSGAVGQVFPDKSYGDFGLFLFSHFH